MPRARRSNLSRRTRNSNRRYQLSAEELKTRRQLERDNAARYHALHTEAERQETNDRQRLARQYDRATQGRDICLVVKGETKFDGTASYLYNYKIPSYQNLNESQRAAYDAAMTKEFCLIQGPPGTGKTYLGLQIARELLLRREGPIFVVCFTNHALDQFLEGLLDTTYDIIRVGGQSKCEALEDFNYQKLKDYRYLHKYYDEEFQVLNLKLKREAALISMLCQYNHIVDINLLSRDYLTCFGKNFKQSWFNRASGRAILDWLCCKSNTRVNIQQPQEGSWRRRAQNNYMEIDKLAEYDFTVSLEKMEQEIFNLRHHLRSLEYKRKHDTLNYLNELKRYQNLQLDYDYICEQLNMLRDLKTNPSVSEINVNYDDPSKMLSRDRWLLYGAWVNDLKEYILNHYQERKFEFDKIKRKMDAEGDWVNADILSEAKVIGMTTTCAAKMHRVIGKLFCPIVIVEEAAEVLEAHIITSLTASCKKLILIGDHQQLKPSTADYQITTKYKLGVSLFERMVNNGVPCYTLTEQRRMRPEIAALISPSIYPILTNGREVEAYPTVRGMTKSLFFITHQNREEVTGTTRRNPFEAQYLILLARHLVLNGYDPKRITMLAAYSGQMHEMQRRQRDHRLLDSMRICVLDNFQGEENDIILLSLVRNNADGINGFLNLENRVCVALSRARHGLFIMGNIAQLCNGNTIWPKVAAVLYEQDAIGEYLTSHCVNHPSTATQVCNITDFTKMPKGGCTVPCKMVLDCGHICKDVCHACNHDEYCCTEPCTRVLCEMGHICPRRCYNDCGDCLVPRECDLSCGHTGDVPCYQTPDDYLCPINVAVKLDCGHENIKKCHEDEDEMVCLHPCVDLLPCGHSCPKLCHPFSDEIHRNMNCRRDCSKSNVLCKVENGEKHRCKKKCFEHCEICEIAVQRKRKCGHIHEVQCSDDINQVPCNILYEKELSCGHRCMLPCSMKYESTECKTLVSLEVELPCGHQDLKVPCYLKITNDLNKELLDFCAKLCTSVLKCGHLCKGTCGKCAQGRFHVGCQIESCKIEHSMPVRYSSSYMFFLQTLRKYQKDNISLAILKEFKSGIKYNTTNKELRLHSSFCIVKDILEVCSAFKTRDFIKLDNKTKDYLLFLINKCCVMVSMSKQNYDDFKTELDRLKRIVEMDCLRNKYHKVEQDSEFIICQESLFQITKYNQTQDDIIKEHLDRLSKRFNSEPI